MNEGLALTGLNADGFKLLQASVDRTGDVQTAALVSAIALGDHAASRGGRPFDDGGVVGGVSSGTLAAATAAAGALAASSQSGREQQGGVGEGSGGGNGAGMVPSATTRRWLHQQTQWMVIYGELLDCWQLWEQVSLFYLPFDFVRVRSHFDLLPRIYFKNEKMPTARAA